MNDGGPIGIKAAADLGGDLVRFADPHAAASQRLGQAGEVDGAEVARDGFAELDRKSTRLNSSHIQKSRMPSSA